jgi:hypothetical protein
LNNRLNTLKNVVKIPSEGENGLEGINKSLRRREHVCTGARTRMHRRACFFINYIHVMADLTSKLDYVIIRSTTTNSPVPDQDRSKIPPRGENGLEGINKEFGNPNYKIPPRGEK